MYNSKYDTELRDETNYSKKTILWVIVLCFVVGGVAWLFSKPAKIADQVIDNSLNNYEAFQEMYNTCKKLDSDLTAIRSINANDPMFSQFSQSAMIVQKQQLINRWVEEYNAKSKMWNRSMWKSSSLPYQLSTNDFPNYR